MTGFIVSYRPSSRPIATSSSTPDLAGLGISIASPGTEQIVTARNSIALVDGYAIGVPLRKLVAALETEDDGFLSCVQGHYCALIIHHSGEIRGYCDRFGAKSVFWQVIPQQDIVISSRWDSMHVRQLQWDEAGLSEMFRYRWTSGQTTVLSGICRLSQWQRVRFTRSGSISVHSTDQKPMWPAVNPAKPFREQLDATRTALRLAFDAPASSHDKAAVFLSGGVDSSLLAAMAESAFDECLLVTPVFAGGRNPELATAKAFATKLGLEHLLVDIDERRLETDLRWLIGAKGGQVKYHLLAMLQMIEAIPDEYTLLVYGEGADTLFGAAPFKRTGFWLLWKRVADLIPESLLTLLAGLPSRRLRKLRRLAGTPVLDVTLRHFLIRYNPAELEIVKGLCLDSTEHIHARRAAMRWWKDRDTPLRRLLQDIGLTIDCSNHFREIDIPATRFGKQVVAPYMSRAVFDVAGTLPDEYYFGTDYVKPVLRELACEHFDRELIYKPKHGFEVPCAEWLSGPLAGLVDRVRQERVLFDGALLRDLDVEGHHQLFWTLINWQLVSESLVSRQSEPLDSHRLATIA